MKPTNAVTVADWRAQVEKELAGVAFDKALVLPTPEGFALQPLYTEAPVAPTPPGGAAWPFLVCMRVGGDGSIEDDLVGGADGLWFAAGDQAALEAALGHGLTAVVDGGVADFEWLAARVKAGAAVRFGADPIAAAAHGGGEVALGELAQLGAMAEAAAGLLPGTPVVRVSTLPFHDAGADAAEEIALALSAGAAYLRVLHDATAARQLWLQVAVGRDTFGELCKLRALRVCWHRLLATAGAVGEPAGLHAVCSSRTLSQRDPWVNMLRVTTEVFAAALGGAALVTPRSFDEALGPPSAHGRRVARNTALVLREESHLGRVMDPAGGSYYLETRTDALAREAWARFQGIEREGGVVTLLRAGVLRERLAAAWDQRAAAIARRKELVLGVSEFANVEEQLPARVPDVGDVPALVPHRDAEGFERLRAKVEKRAPEVVLVAMGPASEHRGRVGYAEAFFATVGVKVSRTLDSAAPRSGHTVVLCGSDERYASEAVETAKRWAGNRIVLAGRPGALEAALREAGVDTFIFVGCDVLATLTDVLGAA